MENKKEKSRFSISFKKHWFAFMLVITMLVSGVVWTAFGSKTNKINEDTAKIKADNEELIKDIEYNKHKAEKYDALLARGNREEILKYLAKQEGYNYPDVYVYYFE